MKRITLPKIVDSLVNMTEEVVVDPAIAAKARRAVERMIYSEELTAMSSRGEPLASCNRCSIRAASSRRSRSTTR